MTDTSPELIYIYLPESIQPLDRGDQYEDPIDDELRRTGLGEVSGAGTQLGDEQPDGSRLIESCGIDVDTTDIDATRDLLRTMLPKLGCPAGTQLQYCIADELLQDEFDGTDWALNQPRTMLHPGFGT